MTHSDLLDLSYVRQQFPGLQQGWTLFDNAGGSQILTNCVERINEFLFERNVQIGGSYAISQAAASALAQARQTVATLINASRPEEVVFGPTSTALLQNLARAMRRQLQAGDEIIITLADHESNIGCWEQLAEFGATIKVWQPNRDTLALELDDLDDLLSSRTRLVCVTHVSNILGSIHPIAEIARRVHAAGARICVDAVAYAPHRAIDVQALDVDYYTFSLYKCYGPHQAVMFGRFEHLLELDSLYHYFYGKDKVPAKLEPGNANYELAYSTLGLRDYLDELGRQAGETGDLRRRIETAFSAIAHQEDLLVAQVLDYLNSRQDCQVVGATENEASTRVPTIAFRFDGREAGELARQMDEYRIAIRFGDFHSRRLVEHLELADRGGVLRVSLVHYNTSSEVQHLCTAFDEILGRQSA